MNCFSFSTSILMFDLFSYVLWANLLNVEVEPLRVSGLINQSFYLVRSYTVHSELRREKAKSTWDGYLPKAGGGPSL